MGIAVAGGGVKLKSQLRCPPHIGKCVARERADCPGPDGIATNAPGLAHDFEIAFEAAGLGVETHVNAVSALVPADAQVLCAVLREVSIIGGRRRLPH